MNNISVKYNSFDMNYDDNDIKILFDICKKFRLSIGNPLDVGFDKEVNLLCKIDFDNRGSLEDVVSNLIDTELYKYVSSFISQSQERGIKNISTFRCWIQGNDNDLPMNNIKKLSAHTHPFRMPKDTEQVNTYTFVVPLVIRENIEEYFWTKYIENPIDTIPKSFLSSYSLLEKIKLTSYDNEKLKTKQNLDFMDCWQNLRENYLVEEMKYFLPNKNNQMTIDFNSKNLLHGIDKVNSNLYLFALFDDYTI